MTTEEKVQFLGEELLKEIDRVNKLIELIGHIYEDVNELLGRNWELNYNRNQLDNRFNELTHLHNEVTDIQKHLGLDGSVPKTANRYEYR
jgi:hypothetical protein